MLYKMPEPIELHLSYDRGTPKETRITVYATQERVDKILAIQKEKKLTLTEAYDQTEDPELY